MIHPSFSRVLACVCLLAMALALAGCERKVTAANYDRVTNGMSRAQVEKILGSGTDDTSSAGYGVSTGGVLDSKAATETTLVWRENGLVIQVILKDGKVVQKTKRDE